MQWRRFRAGLGAFLVAAGTLVAVPAGSANARPIEDNFSISFASSAFGSRFYTRRDSQIVVNQENQVRQQKIGVAVRRGNNTEIWFDFSTRQGSGQDFQVGYYGDAQRHPFSDPGRPGISISGGWGFCNGQSGDFDVRDVQRDGLSITRLWITFQRYCDGSNPMFGELKLGYPDTAYDVSPQNARWPGGTYPGRTAEDVPIRVRTTSQTPVEVTGIRVEGPHAAEFPLRSNDCAGTLTACTATVGFTPAEPGPRHADLVVSTSAGETVVALDAAGALGRSEWAIDIDYADPTRKDEHLVMPYSASRGNPYEFQSQAFEPDGTIWQSSFDFFDSTRFAEGHYDYNPDGMGLLLSLSRGNNACVIDRGSIDIADIAFQGPDEQLAQLDLTLDVHCRYNPGHTVKGRLQFHDRDDETPPAAVTDLSATRADGNVTLTWTNPDAAGVIVRWNPGPIAPGATDAGRWAYAGPGETVTFPAEGPIAATVWTHDTAGNLSAGKEIALL